MADALVTQLARALNLSPDAARHTLNHLVAALREQIDATGTAAVPGLGTFRLDDDDQLAFDPDDALARAVNHRYAGLRPIAASRSITKPAPPEPADPFEAVAPSAEESEPAPAAEFQPIEAFIEPSEPEPSEPEPSEPEPSEPEPSEPEAAETDDVDTASLDEVDEAEAKPTDVEETASTFVAPLVPEDDPFPEDEPFEEDEPAADETPVAGEEPIADDEILFEEEPVVEEEPIVEEEPVAETESASEEEDIDELLAGTWVTTSALSEEEHPLGAMPDEPVEEAERSVVEPEDAAESEDEDLDWEMLDADAAAELDTEAATDDAFDYDEVAETDEPEFVEAEDDDEVYVEEASVLAIEPPPVTEPEPETHSEAYDEPAAEPAVPTVAPAVAATGAAAPAAARPPAAPERGSSMRVLGGIAAVLLLALVALLWFLNREPDGPVVAERQPVPADTVVALPPPVDTSAVAADTTAIAAAPEPEPPAPPDPLRSSEGIDRADGGFSWIVASEFSRAPAERRVAAFREQGFRADVIAEEANGRTRYRVALGQFASIDEADRFRSDLPAGVPSDTWLLRL